MVLGVIMIASLSRIVDYRLGSFKMIMFDTDTYCGFAGYGVSVELDTWCHLIGWCNLRVVFDC